MTKDEIKKALEICAQDSLDCGSCCYSDNYTNCVMRLKDDALNLITEQENEIDQLKNSYARLQKLFAQYQMASDKEIMAQRKRVKIDVLNELKKKTHNYYPSIDSYCISQHVVLVRDIDELIKEVQNEQKD